MKHRPQLLPFIRSQVCRAWEKLLATSGTRTSPPFVWDMNEGLHRNFDELGGLLASMPGLQLYQTAEGDGLIHVAGEKVRYTLPRPRSWPRSSSTTWPSPSSRTENTTGIESPSRPSATCSTPSPSCTTLKVGKDVVTTPIVHSDDTPSNPGLQSSGRHPLPRTARLSRERNGQDQHVSGCNGMAVRCGSHERRRRLPDCALPAPPWAASRSSLWTAKSSRTPERPPSCGVHQHR